MQTWVGTVTQLIPPNYGIVDHDAFYVEELVVGRRPQVGACMIACVCDFVYMCHVLECAM